MLVLPDRSHVNFVDIAEVHFYRDILLPTLAPVQHTTEYRMVSMRSTAGRGNLAEPPLPCIPAPTAARILNYALVPGGSNSGDSPRLAIVSVCFYNAE